MVNKIQERKEEFEWKHHNLVDIPNYGKLFTCNSPINRCGLCLNTWNYEHEFLYIKEIQKILPKNSIGLDIGAHTGTYGIALKDYVKKMYSFEPFLYPYEALLKNSVMYDNIVPMNFSCGAKSDYGKDVPVIDLDYFFSSGNEDPNFIKIDVEGQEIYILDELASMIHRTDYLIMLIEFDPKHYYPWGLDESHFFAGLKKCGLDCTQIWEKEIKPIFTKTFFCNILIEKKQEKVDAKILTYYKES